MAGSKLDKKFVEEQERQLEELKEKLLGIQQGMNDDEQERAEEQRDTQLDSGDLSQEIFTREMDATIEEQVSRRLEDVERALEKVADGSYGICDDTGEEIPRGRLEAVPEAIRTVEAQQSFERERRPPV
jgi:DnaK suppressor protein